MGRTTEQLLIELKARFINERNCLIGVLGKMKISEKTRYKLQLKLDDRKQIINDIDVALLGNLAAIQAEFTSCKAALEKAIRFIESISLRELDSQHIIERGGLLQSIIQSRGMK
jgi:hypothetical protein